VSGQQDHDLLVKALQSVANVTHRGAVDADLKTGDGAGVLTQLPYRLLVREAARHGVRVAEPRDLAVGMIFLPERDRAAREACVRQIESTCHRNGLTVLAWRDVPVDLTALGQKASDTRPRIAQLLLGRPAGQSDDEFERTLFLTRRQIELWAEGEKYEDLYIPSFSSRTLVYKGLMIAPQLPTFFADLRDPDYETALALFHQRYSTNTLPNWFLAQPFRLLAHNGEINTLQGNRNWMRAREAELESPIWGERLRSLLPVIWEAGSDSASLDQALELVERSGRDLLRGMLMLIPSAWENLADMDPEVRAFYEYQSLLTEPWDGPAALTFSDGAIAGAVLDRNGLRPSRYKITEDGLVVAASEVGVFELDDRKVVEKGRLGPGEMLAVDTRQHRILKNQALKREVAGRLPYAEWLAERRLFLPPADGTARVGVNGTGQAAHADGPAGSTAPNGSTGHLNRSALDRPAEQSLERIQRAFGYTAEEVRMVVRPMGVEGAEPTFSMGDDAPPAILSTIPRTLYTYFKQRFAQVTNPPIDPLRERMVMSLKTQLGRRGSYLVDSAEHAALLFLDSPILTPEQLTAIRAIDQPSLRPTTLEAVFPADDGPDGLARALDRLCAEAEQAVDAGHGVLILSDRAVGPRQAAVPMLLAIGAVHHHLIRVGKRMQADLIAEAGDAWDVHHFACLIGYGAGAVSPWLALETIEQVLQQDLETDVKLAGRRGQDPAEVEREGRERLPMQVHEARERLLSAAEKGLLKILSKMGISTISSYRGAQIFEVLGLSDEILKRAFVGPCSRIGGIGLSDLGQDILARHRQAFAEGKTGLPDYGFIRFRREGEYHGFNPMVVRALQKAAREGDRLAYRGYVKLVEERPPTALRDLLQFVPLGEPVPLDQVEPVEVIRRRFISTAMSLGALSPEAHRTLAIGVNRIGARSNSGEGGEDPQNYQPLPNGDVGHNKIKQVASGRFGVTAEYLAMAEELEIKMAQGSKPGEGGQLPGHKVTTLIARLRHAVPGIGLISPPPHHDIYSIEDLAQLIYDLKQANPRARVGVKLVAEMGVGTIAAGVAKAYADYVLISGYDGGTGASPLSSIKNAGCPWELGLAETQQTLVRNDLRGRIVVRTDGGLKTGRDVLVAAMLGAEEFGFGTAAVVAIGCDMARQCHLNTCPAGIATQREDLRLKFTGTPEQVVHYFTHLAEEVRELLALLGCRSVDEVVGRSDLLRRRPSTETGRVGLVDVSRILEPADATWTKPRRNAQQRNVRPNDTSLDLQIVRDAEESLEHARKVRLSYRVLNSDRAVGTRLSGEIARRYGSKGLPDATVELRFRGSAGQSFGAWACRGMRLLLEGEANDYVGKGLCGGELVVTPPQNVGFQPHENVIVGNTVLYGATGGRLYAAGQAGERFAVRNSGAVAVVEGVGDHGCEYMTGGVVVVLGPTGRNFAAGMSNGVAYVLDEQGQFPQRVNRELVHLERVMRSEDLELLYTLLREHFERTGSPRADELLSAWDAYRELFWKVAADPPPAPPAPAPSAAGAPNRAGAARV
jgi:glutamate synthase domain-containing protein 2/glutamate synthase domain-containing protein 1/glutamate synthase domain-containing protein 3